MLAAFSAVDNFGTVSKKGAKVFVSFLFWSVSLKDFERKCATSCCKRQWLNVYILRPSQSLFLGSPKAVKSVQICRLVRYPSSRLNIEGDPFSINENQKYRDIVYERYKIKQLTCNRD